MATPTLNVSVEDKLGLLSGIVAPLARELLALSAGNDLSGDDLVDVFALALAAIIENDSHLTTPEHIRLAVKAVGKRIAERIELLRLHHLETGVSVLDTFLTGRQPDAPLN